MSKKGSVMMIGLWVMAILVVFAVGLGSRAAINLRLSRYQRDSLKSYYLAKAGVNKAVTVLDADTKSNGFDTLKESWSTGKDETAGKFILKDIELKEKSKETFTVGYSDKDGVYHCITDEESRLNINGVSEELGKQQFIELLKAKDFAEDKATALAGLVKEWVTPVTDPSPEEGVILKKNFFKVREELVPVLEDFLQKQGSTDPAKEAQVIYEKIKDLIAVNAESKVNINTAPEYVLRAIVSAVSVQVGSTAQDAEILIKLVLGSRGSFTGQADIDKVLAEMKEGSQLNLKSKFISQVTWKSEVFRIISTGNANGVLKRMEVVYKRGAEGKAGKILSWQEN